MSHRVMKVVCVCDLILLTEVIDVSFGSSLCECLIVWCQESIVPRLKSEWLCMFPETL